MLCYTQNGTVKLKLALLCKVCVWNACCVDANRTTIIIMFVQYA